MGAHVHPVPVDLYIHLLVHNPCNLHSVSSCRGRWDQVQMGPHAMQSSVLRQRACFHSAGRAGGSDRYASASILHLAVISRAVGAVLAAKRRAWSQVQRSGSGQPRAAGA